MRAHDVTKISYVGLIGKETLSLSIVAYIKTYLVTLGTDSRILMSFNSQIVCGLS